MTFGYIENRWLAYDLKSMCGSFLKTGNVGEKEGQHASFHVIVINAQHGKLGFFVPLLSQELKAVQ